MGKVVVSAEGACCGYTYYTISTKNRTLPFLEIHKNRSASLLEIFRPFIGTINKMYIFKAMRLDILTIYTTCARTTPVPCDKRMCLVAHWAQVVFHYLRDQSGFSLYCTSLTQTANHRQD